MTAYHFDPVTGEVVSNGDQCQASNHKTKSDITNLPSLRAEGRSVHHGAFTKTSRDNPGPGAGSPSTAAMISLEPLQKESDSNAEANAVELVSNHQNNTHTEPVTDTGDARKRGRGWRHRAPRDDPSDRVDIVLVTKGSEERLDIINPAVPDPNSTKQSKNVNPAEISDHFDSITMLTGETMTESSTKIVLTPPSDGPPRNETQKQTKKTGAPVPPKAKTSTMDGSKIIGRRVQSIIDLARIAQDVKHARVLRYEYPEPLANEKRHTLRETAHKLCDKLVSLRESCSERPVIFVGHEFDVVIIEEHLMLAARIPLFKSLCHFTIGVVLLWTPTDASSREEQDREYFEIKEQRMKWTPKSESKIIARSIAPPYSEIDHRNKDTFLRQHLTRFKKLHDWRSTVHSAMNLACVRTDSHRIHEEMLDLIDKNLKTHQLLDAARWGKTHRLRHLRERGGNIDTQDAKGQSALLIAVREGHTQTVRLLLGRGEGNPSIRDARNWNALHYAARHCSADKNKLQDMVQLLVDQGVDLDAEDNEGISSKAAATQARVNPIALQKTSPYKGPLMETQFELKRLSMPNSDLARHACHSHLATLAEFYNIEGQEHIVVERPSVYELLYESGPKKILRASRCRRPEGSRICEWYHLPANHVGWVEDLFVRMGVATEPLHYDQHSGAAYWSQYMRPQARVFEYVRQNMGCRATPQFCNTRGEGFVLYLPYLSQERRCDLTAISLAIKQAQNLEKRLQVSSKEHLEPDEAQTSASIRPSDQSDSKIMSTLNTESSRRGTQDGSATLVSQAATEQLTSVDSIPLWDPDNDDSPQPNAVGGDEDGPKLEHNPLDGAKNLALGYLTDKPATLHHRRTLDQSHYFMLNDTSKRDEDQVVLRRAREQWMRPTENTDPTEKHPLVMVDQLWIWIVGTTVITSFPQKWMQDDFQRDGDVLEQLLKHLKDKKRLPISSPQDLARLIICFCVDIFSRRSPSAGLQLRDLFEASIGMVADEQMTMFRRFGADSETDLMSLYRNRKSHNDLDHIFDTKDEIMVLDEIKDIRDELKMILDILRDQALSVQEMQAIISLEDPSRDVASSRTFERDWRSELTASSPQKNGEQPIETDDNKLTVPKKSERTTDKYQNPQRIIDANIRDFTRMLDHANTSYEELNHLLDLKQKQANAWEARLARIGTEASGRQSNTIMVFTVATIFFGSLSFVTALFALNVEAYPHDGSTTIWRLGTVLGLVAVFSIGLSAPFIFLAFNINFLTEVIPRWMTGSPKNAKCNYYSEHKQRHRSEEVPALKTTEDNSAAGEEELQDPKTRLKSHDVHVTKGSFDVADSERLSDRGQRFENFKGSFRSKILRKR